MAKEHEGWFEQLAKLFGRESRGTDVPKGGSVGTDPPGKGPAQTGANAPAGSAANQGGGASKANPGRSVPSPEGMERRQPGGAVPVGPELVKGLASAEEGHFRMPEPWVSRGEQLQPERAGTRVLPVRIGVDFGTAYTKVAMTMAGKTLIVDWDGLQRAPEHYLLGAHLSETAAGAVFVGLDNRANRRISDLKLPFVERHHQVNDEEMANATMFLSWVVKYARAWLYQYHASVIDGTELRWELNLGAPTGSWAADGAALRERYLQLGLAAWRLSQESGVTLRRARVIMSETPSQQFGWGLEQLSVLPEFAAQIAGYVHSPQRRDGLYLLVDVGSGTLDVACFRIMKNQATGVDRFPVFAALVRPLGTHYLMLARGALARGVAKSWRGTFPVPTIEGFAASAGVNAREVQLADDRVSESVARAVLAVLSETRFGMDRNAVEFRKQGSMPVFMAGGGASLAPYRRGVEEGFRLGGFKFHLVPFPRESGTDARFGFDDDTANRTSVARGLTYDAELIGDLIPSSEIPPDPMPTSAVKPDRDELYPK